MLQKISAFDACGHAMADLQLFAGVIDPKAAAIVGQCDVVRVAAGSCIAQVSDAPPCVYIVLHGALGATPAPAGDHAGPLREERVLPGESIGELSVLDETVHFSALVALQDSELLVIEPHTLWRLIDESNGVARNLLRQLSFRLRAANAQLRKREKVGEFYRRLSMVDALTGLHNRAWLEERLPGMVAEAHQAGRPLAAIMIDLDHFKRFNDAHGHPGGDSALRTAAGVLTAALRPTDFAVRFGGEEMVVILPDSDAAAGLMVAERLCERMRAAIVFADMRLPLPHITASFGVAALQPDQNADALLSHADLALYRAKKDGRDRVAC